MPRKEGKSGALTATADLLADVSPFEEETAEEAAPPSKRMLRRVERVLAVREDREQDRQRVGYLARPFILCGLPFKRPPKGTSYYKRQNGDEVLEITASP